MLTATKNVVVGLLRVSEKGGEWENEIKHFTIYYLSFLRVLCACQKFISISVHSCMVGMQKKKLVLFLHSSIYPH